MSVGMKRAAVRLWLPLSTAAVLVGFAATPALAATTLTVTSGGSNISDGDVVSDAGQITAKGSTDAAASSRQLELSVSVPGHGTVSLKTGSAAAFRSGTLSGSVDTSCPDWSSSPCVEAVNGSYTFTFKAGSA